MIDIPPEVKAYRDLHFPSRADTNAVIDSLLARLESEHDRAEDLLADKDEMLDALGHMIEDTPAEEIRRLKAILHDTQEAWLYERGKREKLERDLLPRQAKRSPKSVARANGGLPTPQTSAASASIAACRAGSRRRAFSGTDRIPIAWMFPVTGKMPGQETWTISILSRDAHNQSVPRSLRWSATGHVRAT